MKGLMRMLMMFGPMIFRQYQKYQQKKSIQQAPPKTEELKSKEQQAREN